jgi:lipoprotein-releasing system ATP-binding protein
VFAFGALSVDQLAFSYRRNLDPVISSFSYEFRPGCVTVVTGPSGSGKSTLLYLLALLLRPTSGRILLGGREVSRSDDIERSRLRATLIGFVFQDAVLDPSRTILDNVTEAGFYAGMDSGVSKQRATTLLDEMGVEKRAGHRPGEISGGQAQRVAVCRALLKQPKLILADEPTGNLDPVSGDIVYQSLKRAAEAGATVVIATHDQFLVRAADAVIAFE